MKTINKNTCHYPAGLDNPEKGNSHFTRYSGQARVGQTKKAFTLVELIIVISILAILATIAFISFQNFTKDARDGNRVSTIKNIESGLELYTIKTGNYPQPEGEISTGTINDQSLTYKGVIGETIGKQINMSKTPLDPLTQKNYVYGITQNKKEYQIASVLEGDTAYQNLIPTTYASTYYSKVSGNYKGFIIYSSGSGINTETWIANIPSLIYNFTGTTNLLSTTGAYFIINKGKNLPYAPNPQTQINHKTLAETIQEKTNKSEAKIVNMKKSDLETIAKTGTGNLPDGVTSTGELFSSFGVETKESLEVLVTGTVIQSSTPPVENLLTISPYSSETPYKKGESFTFDGFTWYVSENTKVAYTKTTLEGQDLPNNLTKTDHILVFKNGESLTKGSTAFILRTVNQGATQVYNYGTAYQSGATYSGTIVSSDEPTRKLYYTADKEMLGGYYQWGRNDPVSLLSTTGSLYNTTGYLTGGVNLSGSGFILGPTSPWSWMHATQHSTSSSIIWTDASNPGPCIDSEYRLPTGGNPGAGHEWEKVVQLVTGTTITSGWNATQRQDLQKYLLLPMAGYRSYSTGDFNNQGSDGRYWSSSVNGGYGRYLYFHSTGIYPSSYDGRANGFSVRCFKN